MYEDMYKDYSDISIWAAGQVKGEVLFITEDKFPYDYPFSFKEANKQYLKPYPPINAWWYYGETVKLAIKLSNYSDTSIFDNKTLKLTFYNFRKENILEKKDFVPNELITNNDSIFLPYSLSREDSEYLFTRGIYYCGVESLVISDEKIQEDKVILNRDDYVIRVI